MTEPLASLLSSFPFADPAQVPDRPLPFCVFTDLGAALLHRADGRDYACRRRFQVTAFAHTRDEAASLFASVDAVLFHRGITRDSSFTDFDVSMLTHSAGGRYSFDQLL